MKQIYKENMLANITYLCFGSEETHFTTGNCIIGFNVGSAGLNISRSVAHLQITVSCLMQNFT